MMWVGENGVRLYAAGDPRGKASPLIHQAVLAHDQASRLRVAQRVYEKMFGEAAPARRSIEQLRGIEGMKVRAIYLSLARENCLEWEGRDSRTTSKPIDAALAGVNAALYGITEAAILALGYSPAIGFVHRGDKRSFVFDIADTVKFATVVPLAFKLAKEGGANMEHRSRTACRELFAREMIVNKLIANIEGVLDADAST